MIRSAYKELLNKNKKYYEKNKDTRKEKMKNYYYKNKNKLASYKKTYYEKNKEYVKLKVAKYRKSHNTEIKTYMKRYWEKNKDKLKILNAKRNKERWKNMSPEKRIEYWKRKCIYEKNRRKTNLSWALKKRLRVRVWQAFNGIRKKHSDEMGINYTSIVQHLKETLPIDYKENPTKYEIDHIIPISTFDLQNPEQIQKAFAPENHQWLTASENSIKKDLSPEEWLIRKQKDLNSSKSNNKIMLNKTTPISAKSIKKAKKIRPTDIDPSYSHIAGDPEKNERINFKHWNDLLFGKDDDNDTTYSNLWLYRNPQKLPPFRDDIGSPSQTQAKSLGKEYFSEFNPLIAENIINFWSDENDTILDPFAGRTRAWVAGLKHRHYIGFEISPIVHKSTLKIIEEGKDKFDIGFKPTIYCDDSMNILKYNLPKIDCIFSCPPYFTLEEYESIPGQLTDIKVYDDFLVQYKEIMKRSLDRLKDNGFCALVVGDYRIGDRFINLDHDTVRIMEELGVQLWDKIILQNINFGWAGIKFGHVKHKRITSKVTEYLLIFKKIPK